MSTGEDHLQATQIAMNSNDLPGTLRLYADLGFQNAGGHMIWGDSMAIQGLPHSSRGIMWWLTGRQARFQLEIFHITEPPQRPLPSDWRCSDLGWTRFGIAVPDYDAAKTVLAKWNVTVKEAATGGGPRRLVFRDPFVGCFVEIFEDHDSIVGGRALRDFNAGPAVVYVTMSVSDLAGARTYYNKILGQRVDDGMAIHAPEDEALWGLAGARSESFVVAGGPMLVEVVQYLDPIGRPQPLNHTVGDQGILNIAMFSHAPDIALAAIERARALGYKTGTTITMGEACGAYILEPEREVEVGSLPASLEAAFGYAPSTPFFGQAH